MNHSRSNAPVRHCPTCGEIVNTAVKKPCHSGLHDSRRKSGDHYCYDCGIRLSSKTG